MEAIFINRQISNTEAKNIQKKFKDIDGIVLYSNVNLPTELNNLSKGSIELTAEEKRNINYDIFEQVLNFGEKKIEGTPVTELLMIEKASIWHYHKFRTYFYIRNLYYEIKLIKNLLNKFDKVIFYSVNESFKYYDFKSSGLEIKFSNPGSKKINFVTIIKYSFFFFLRILIALFQQNQIKKRKHIVIDHAIKQIIINIKTFKEEYGNYFLAYLFEKLDDDFFILDDVEIPKLNLPDFKLHTYFFRKSKNRLFGEFVIFKGLLSRKVRVELKKYTLKLEMGYKSIAAANLNDTENLIFQHLTSLHKTSKLFIFKYFSYKRFFRKYKIKTITSIDENSARIKSILDAAKSQNIHTIGIQHGTIHELHPAYIYTPDDQNGKIVPDYTLIWGKHWKELLIQKGNYRQESLITTGQIRTDIIPKLLKADKKGYYKLSKNTKLIVFASQPQRDPVLRKQAAFDVFKAASEIENIYLVVKLHPAEKDDFKYYNTIAKEAGCKNYSIILEFDLYLLISTCDILITCFSTVGAETVYFNKPLIILDHIRQDVQGYHKEGIAFQATNKEELKNIIENLLSGKSKINRSAYQNYIENYAFRIDGKVSERIIQFIKSI
ncbi:MAG: CDP-glycerol glycerophosphotransferase family protein [Bacteroidetes bacterium]|nr:CDP-glycerol glycerophosphotransferase family protein [Bacteroidota bacterium]MBL7104064.1 CDP-glycerol glycerophosphotransferase family protein [Bacteroidales bacterium]